MTKHPRDPAVGFRTQFLSPNIRPKIKRVVLGNLNPKSSDARGTPHRKNPIWMFPRGAANIEIKCGGCGNDFVGRPGRKVCKWSCVALLRKNEAAKKVGQPR